MTADGRPRRAVFLDRDGVINRKPPDGSYVRDWSEFELLPGVLGSLKSLCQAGAGLFVVTNQRGVARGLIPPANLDVIHARLTAELASAGVTLGGIYACPHEAGICDCRKPGVGLFMQARRDHPWISFEHSDLIGDSLSDLEAGAQLGMRLWLVADGERGRIVARRAQQAGIRVEASAPSLQALVEEQRLVQRHHAG